MRSILDRFFRYGAALRAALSMHLHRFGRVWITSIFVITAVTTVGYWVVLAPPARFVPGTTVVIAPNASAQSDARMLAEARVIKYPRALVLLLRMLGAGKIVKEGAYRFASPENAVTIARRLARGDYGIPSMRITFREGMSVREMAQEVAVEFPQIASSDFIAAGQPYEGYLFPDTYTFAPSATANSIVQEMHANFETKTALLRQQLATSTHPFSDVVIVASLVQDEAATTEDQRMIAGIMWNRLTKDMPLQVDAVFGYIYGKRTYSPSFADLSVDSPYNTYTHTGLPPGPIGNPGLSALEAAAFPIKSKYLFYLTGKDGRMHYAATYAQHLANERAYL